ncbi:MAG: GDSL-type esterase/lipase family protein [Akkermansia sp.]|nr:GDSL-type esterase/lipase family protein [Akkermansia sp.]
MYVGDSITHGVASGSYRWAMHKILVDNGISYNEEGISTGNYSGGVTAGTLYGGTAFANLHSSQASARAWELSGNASYDASSSWKKSGGTRYNGSNIMNWLGQSTVNNNNAAYTGATFTGEQTPDMFFLMIGTNDLLSDTNKGSSLVANKEAIFKNLLADVEATYQSMMTANSDATVVVSLIPAYCQTGTSSADNVHAAVQEYNQLLTEWAKDKKGVTLVDVNQGITDVTSSKALNAVPATMNSGDGLHPTAQGDLIIAGNMARALGYGGRTAGKERVAATSFATVAAGSCTTVAQYTSAGFTATGVVDNNGKLDFSSSGASTLSYSWNIDPAADKGFTVDFSLSLGNGQQDGWNTTDNFSVTVGNGAFSGTLNISEAYIKWGDSILYSADMSQNTDSLRISYIYGNGTDNLLSGYYVWLGDMLVGEGLGYTADTANNGVIFSYSGTGSALLGSVALDSTAAYAPVTQGLYNAESHYQAPMRGEVPLGPGTIQDWAKDVPQSATVAPAAADSINLRRVASFSSGDAAVEATLSAGSGQVYANSGDYSGDVWVNITSGSASAWYGAHGGSGTLNGSAYLKLTDTVSSGSTVFGAVNAAKVTGNVYVEISAESASFSSFTGTAGQQASFAGVYKANVDGSLTLVANAGTFTADIYGGIHTGAGYTIAGGTQIHFNGGTAQGSIYGAGREGTVKSGTSVMLSGGTVNGSVYGGGTGGSVEGDSTVSLAGGTVSGTVYGGGSGGTVTGDSKVSVLSGSYAGRIYGGGSGGTVSGISSVLVGGDSTVVSGYIAGAGSGGTVTNSQVQITGGRVASVFGGGMGGTVTGDTSILMSGGQAANLFGGNLSANSGDVIGGNTSVVMTGGTVTGEVAGGCGTTNSSQRGNSTVRILGGTVKGSVFGGSNAGNVGGNASVELGIADKQTGAMTEVDGDVYGGNEKNFSVGGNSSVAITDTDVIVKGSIISAGSKGNTVVAGDSQLKLANIDANASRSQNDITHYSGTFSGGSNVNGTRELVISNVQASFADATFANFDSISVTDASAVTLSGTGGASDVFVSGDSQLNFISSTGALTWENLDLGESTVIGVYSAPDTEATITVTETLKAGSGSLLNANLIMADNSSLSLASGGLNMGSTLTVGSGITLDNDMVETLEDDGYLLLFSGVDAITLSADGISRSTEAITYEQGVEASDYFNIPAAFGADALSGVRIVYSGAAGAGTVAIMKAGAVPEPATGTLALLALAGLCGRRRRK